MSQNPEQEEMIIAIRKYDKSSKDSIQKESLIQKCAKVALKELE